MRQTFPALPRLDQNSLKTPDSQVSCPHCGEEISLSEALRTQYAERFEKEFKRKEAEAVARMKGKEDLLVQKAQQLEKEFSEKFSSQKASLEKDFREQAAKAKHIELEDLKNQIAEKDKRLSESMQSELDLRKRARLLEEREKTLELDLVRKMDAGKQKLEEEISKRLGEDQRFKMAEKDKQLDDMRKTIEELKRKSEVTSQQLQGEVLELELEGILKRICPIDDIAPVAKGAKGGDIVQKVMSTAGQHVGTVVWETKRTKAWTDHWIDKIKEDQRAISAECAVIVSDVLPKGVTGLSLCQGVWICDTKTALGLATVLRVYLLQLHSARTSVAGKDAKMEVVYRYLTGTQFAQTIQSMVETYKEMQTSLLSEKKAIQKIWAQREMQLEKMVFNTASLYGSVQGIIGAVLPKIEALELGQGVARNEEHG